MQGTTDGSSRPEWVEPLYRALGLNDTSSVREVFERADDVATRLAPDTRRLWKWILVLEGGAVLLPLLWLLVLRLRWPPVFAAYAVLVCTFVVVGICWWLRWRGMQHTWVRSRMLAEILRSVEHTRWLPGRQTEEALVSAPLLQAIIRALPDAEGEPTAVDLEQLKQRYLAERVRDQLAYYRKKRDAAAVERHRLSRYVTWSLDGALFLAVTGLILVQQEAGLRFLRVSGVDYVLGGIGTLLPLMAILMQTLSSYLELNRRTGRYAQQIDFLCVAEDRLQLAPTLDTTLTVVQDVERALLGEVIEWFYEAEHTESFYRSKSRSATQIKVAVIDRRQQRWMGRIMSILGSCASYAGRVIFGRVLVVALSMVITTALIAYYAPQDHTEKSVMSREDGRLLSSPKAEGWEPVPEHAENGFILIAHGLHDGVETAPKEGAQPHWMTKMQIALENRLAQAQPEICLVDWRRAAVPAVFSGAGLETGTSTPAEAAVMPKTPQGWLQDVAAIRPQAEEIGRLVGLKLALAIADGKISRDKPMHLIGHSAGGFVVLQAAKILHKLNLASDQLTVTILDTPIPAVSDIEDVLAFADVDYYCTSAFAQGVPAAGFHPRYMRFDIPVPDGIDDFTGAHSYAHQWFIRTIADGDPRGFARSPFAGQVSD